jgi:hypothetical protein
MKAVYAKMQAANPNLWLMQNDGFAGAARWTPYWNTTDKWMLDVVRDIPQVRNMHLIFVSHE